MTRGVSAHCDLPSCLLTSSMVTRQVIAHCRSLTSATARCTVLHTRPGRGWGGSRVPSCRLDWDPAITLLILVFGFAGMGRPAAAPHGEMIRRNAQEKKKKNGTTPCSPLSSRGSAHRLPPSPCYFCMCVCAMPHGGRRVVSSPRHSSTPSWVEPHGPWFDSVAQPLAARPWDRIKSEKAPDIFWGSTRWQTAMISPLNRCVIRFHPAERSRRKGDLMWS